MKMTSHSASDRPSAEDVVSVLRELHVQVNPSQPVCDVDPSLRLLQALNDMSKAAIGEIITAPDAVDWINGHIDTERHIDAKRHNDAERHFEAECQKQNLRA